MEGGEGGEGVWREVRGRRSGREWEGCSREREKRGEGEKGRVERRGFEDS